MNDCFTLDSLSPNSHSELGDYLYIKLKDIKSQNRPIIFLCIGTDRATGDSLGPLIGYKLKDLSQKNIYIYGSLEYPIHSVNLVEILNKIAIMRYKAFEDIGSDLSFSVAILDSFNDGVIITGIYSRHDSTTYAKPIDKGISRYDLSEEEIHVLNEAINSKN